ncbi:MAG: DUF2269 domain-containing protein [Ectothiorhodospiraceae bacterium]|nr:DUF2269 domain-containing protein [Ectothiorhodospiraceae bacterium]
MEFAMIKWVHILSATILFGTGFGSAFYKWCADRSQNLPVIAHTNKVVVFADWIFTTPAVIIQPISGIWLVSITERSLYEPWVVLAFVFYFIAGACWLPVVRLQIKMRNLSSQSLLAGTHLPPQYQQYARQWFWLGIPAFVAMMVVYYLMVFKPVIV